MCHNDITVHRCGHRSYSIKYCKDSYTNPFTKQQNMCGKNSTSASNQADSLCEQPECELRKKRGVWICCTCDFGWQEDGPNRYRMCSKGGCIHSICGDCKIWNPENVTLMRAAFETEQANAAEEQQTEDSPDSEDEPTEDNSDGGEAEEYSYEGEDEEEVEYSAYHEEVDDTIDYSLYTPNSDDDDTD